MVHGFHDDYTVEVRKDVLQGLAALLKKFEGLDMRPDSMARSKKDLL